MTSTKVLVILHCGAAAPSSVSGAAPNVRRDAISTARGLEKTRARYVPRVLVPTLTGTRKA